MKIIKELFITIFMLFIIVCASIMIWILIKFDSIYLKLRNKLVYFKEDLMRR